MYVQKGSPPTNGGIKLKTKKKRSNKFIMIVLICFLNFGKCKRK